MPEYGEAPVDLGHMPLAWAEFMHYMYLPVRIPGHPDTVLEPRLEFLFPLIHEACTDYLDLPGAVPLGRLHIYVTAKRRHASVDNPLNRPGWHCDGFGTEDVNYVWWDRWGTRFAVQPFEGIDPGHAASMDQFEQQVDPDFIMPVSDQHLYRLSPYVVHNTPIVPAAGGTRSFIKISFSEHRYNLEGNSHNHGLDYGWTMHPRAALRNDPANAGKDYLEVPGG